MLHVSRAMVIGFVSQTPQIEEIRGRGKVGKMRVLTSIRHRRRGAESDERQIEDLHSIVTFGAATAVVERKVRKGTRVMVEGQLQYRFYEDRAGNERRVAEIIVTHQGMINVLGEEMDGGAGNGDESDD